MPTSPAPFLASLYQGVQRRLLAHLGDSISQNGVQANTATDRRRSTTGFSGWLPFLTRGRVYSPLDLNFGINGNTVAQMRARVGAVVAARPSCCTVLGGTNSIIGDVPAATIIQDLTAIYNALQAADITVIAIPILGRNLNTAPLTLAQAQAALAVNRWIRNQRRVRRNFYVADCQLAFDDPANAIGATAAFAPRVGFTYDGLHPNPVGAFPIAKAVADILRAIYPDPYIPIVHGADTYSAANPTGSLLTNGLMTGTGGSPGSGFTGLLADGWASDPVASLGGAAGVFSKVAMADGRAFQRLVLSGTYNSSSAAIDITTSVSSGMRGALVAGDLIEASAEAFFDGSSQNFAGAALTVLATVGGTTYQASDLWTNINYSWPSAAMEGVYTTPQLVLPGTPSALTVRLQVALAAVTGASPAAAAFNFGSVELRRVPADDRPSIPGSPPMRFAARSLAAAFAALCMLAVAPAHAAQFTNPVALPVDQANNWIDLGAGPLTVIQRFSYGPVSLVMSDARPAAGALGEDLAGRRAYAGTSHVWGLAVQTSSSVLVVQEGAAGTSTNPLTVNPAGSTGLDFSANPLPVPMAGFALLTTVPASASRAYVEVQNQGASAIQILRDDGAGNNVTSILAAPGSADGTQGGGWSSATFKGRVRVYGGTGARAAGYQD